MTGSNWRPRAETATLRHRAAMLAHLRAHFAETGVLEVDSPARQAGANLDPGIEPHAFIDGFLITSPEHHLKRCLAAGLGGVYALREVHRAGELSPRHLPSFTMCEWYRLGTDLDALIDEVVEVCGRLAVRAWPVHRHRYADLLEMHAGVDPDADLAALRSAVGPDAATWSRRECVDYLFAERVELRLERGVWTVVEDFPADLAAQARIERRADGRRVARRFELHGRGLELANGYLEETDAEEIAARMEIRARELADATGGSFPLDTSYLAALRAGLPPCCGVALGFDRLVMIACDLDDIREAVAFPDG